jgi:hypothetical protein
VSQPEARAPTGTLLDERAEQYFVATQWQLMWRKFTRHRLAVIGGVVLVLYSWLMFPALFVVVAVLMFNFLGDGLRDAADPYK